MVAAGILGMVFAVLALVVLFVWRGGPLDAAWRESRLIAAVYVSGLAVLSLGVAILAFYIEPTYVPTIVLVATPALIGIASFWIALVWRRYADRQGPLTAALRRALMVRLGVAEAIGIAGVLIGYLGMYDIA